MNLDTINAILATCDDDEPHLGDLHPLDALLVMGLVETVEESDDWIDAIPAYADEIARTIDNPF